MVSLLSVPLGASLEAQVVRGTVTESGGRVPVAGVVLSLLDEQGKILGEALSDENGAFELRAPGPGRFQLDAKRIGIRRVRIAPFAVGEGETVRQDVALQPIATVLGSVRITGRTSCFRRPAENERTAALWEDARAALSATVLTRRASGPGTAGTIVKFMRKLDAENWKVIFEHRQEIPANMERPFRSLPAEDLSREGYVRVSEDGTTNYYAPDAEVLLSDTFLVDHCFRVEPGLGAREREIGLAFEPVRGRKTPDIRGVLWIDKKTAELRTLEFTFSWLPYNERPENYGGAISFYRMPSGRWIVRSWRIRMPEYGTDRSYVRYDGQVIPLPPSRTPHVVRIVEEGGAVPVGALLAETGTVRGRVVVDSVSNQPVAGATVALGGTGDSTVTDAEGRFAMALVDPGSYTVIIRDPVLDSLGLEHLASTVDVNPGATADIRLTFPSLTELSARLCGDSVQMDREAIIRFIVVDGRTRAPLRGAPVVVSRTKLVDSGSTVIDTIIPRETQLDAQGGYVACGVPPDETVRIESLPSAPVQWVGRARAAPGIVGWLVVRVGQAGRRRGR